MQCKSRLIQNPNYDISSLTLHTWERTVLVLIERNALSRLKLAEERKGSFLRVLPVTDPVETGWGL